MCQGDNRGACIRVERSQGLIWPTRVEGHIGEPFRRRPSAAWVDDDGVKPCEPRHWDERLRDVHRADDNQAFGRIERA